MLLRLLCVLPCALLSLPRAPRGCRRHPLPAAALRDTGGPLGCFRHKAMVPDVVYCRLNGADAEPRVISWVALRWEQLQLGRGGGGRVAAWRNRNSVAKTAACRASKKKLQTPTHKHASTKPFVSRQNHVQPHGGGGGGTRQFGLTNTPQTPAPLRRPIRNCTQNRIPGVTTALHCLITDKSVSPC